MTTNSESKEGKRQFPVNANSRKPRAGLKDFRIIVRNLPFSTTKDELSKFFEKFGPIKDIQLPKCKDSRFPKSCAGFAFIQYSGRNSARDAVNQSNFSEFKGRKIAVDWTLNKDDYMNQNSAGDERQRMLAKAEKFLKKASGDKDELGSEIKEEEEDDEMEIKEEEDDDADIKEEDFDGSEPSDEDISGDEEDFDMKEDQPAKTKAKFERKPDTAVEEGRVIFLRNLSFDTSNESLKEYLSRFGDVSLAIVCKFPGTDQPTGNAFVHFKDRESADKCLEELEVSGLFIDQRIVEGHRAVAREEASKFEKKRKQGKDNRNLKFLRVSLIRPGTAQARGMSEEDGELRQRLAQAAKTKLKHLHMFVSTKRLAVHNLPFSYRDSNLHELCLQHATKNATIRECRIMRNKKGKDDNGRAILGKSKGFGFVEFTEHLDALTCLRNLNNNPDIFTDKKRPIVEFSIEDLKALKIQEKRRQSNNQAEKESRNESYSDKSKRAEELAVQRTKRLVDQKNLKPMPKKLGAKIRHRDAKKKGKFGKQGMSEARVEKLKGRKQNVKKSKKR